MMAHMTRVVAHDDQCANLFRKARQTLPYIGIFVFPSENQKIWSRGSLLSDWLFL